MDTFLPLPRPASYPCAHKQTGAQTRAAPHDVPPGSADQPTRQPCVGALLTASAPEVTSMLVQPKIARAGRRAPLAKSDCCEFLFVEVNCGRDRSRYAASCDLVHLSLDDCCSTQCSAGDGTTHALCCNFCGMPVVHFGPACQPTVDAAKPFRLVPCFPYLHVMPFHPPPLFSFARRIG